MRQHGISVGVHYQPLHHYPIFNWTKPLPVTDRVFARLVDLPIFPDLSVKDQNRVIRTIKEFFAH
jgi:perosamine synthetase